MKGEKENIDSAPLLDVCHRLIKWLDDLSKNAAQNAKTCGYESLRDAYIADEKNYRATASSIRMAVAKSGATK